MPFIVKSLPDKLLRVISLHGVWCMAREDVGACAWGDHQSSVSRCCRPRRAPPAHARQHLVPRHDTVRSVLLDDSAAPDALAGVIDTARREVANLHDPDPDHVATIASRRHRPQHPMRTHGDDRNRLTSGRSHSYVEPPSAPGWPHETRTSLIIGRQPRLVLRSRSPLHCR